jgi:uncharacterized protein (TIGR00255 family)
MLKSMTAYGRASLSTKIGRFVAEIQSLNRKHLEIQILLPKELSRFDTEIRKQISSMVFRGQVSIKISAFFDQTAPIIVTPNLPLVRQIKLAWETIAKDLKLEEQFNLNLLANERDILLYGDNFQNEEDYRTALASTVDMALKEFVAMRIREGEALEQDIANRLIKLRQCLQQIDSRKDGATSKYRQKLKERIEEVLSGSIENEERILREVAIFAERIDIAEEITRFNSHIDQYEQLLKNGSDSLGKTMEFLLQEMNREVNTIGSKSSDIEITRLVLDMKSELERIREQIQNIE